MLVTKEQVQTALENVAFDWIVAFHIVHPESNDQVIALLPNMREPFCYLIAEYDLDKRMYGRSTSIPCSFREAKEKLYLACRSSFPEDADFEYIPVESELYSFLEGVK